MNPVRTRFAPSPTGDLHVGGARTALFNYLYARAKKGQFVLRLEDTDRERSKKKFEKNIVESLDWLGLTADESPQKGGPYGPYRQSGRLETYKKYTTQLLEKNSAYPCFCTNEELQEKQEHAKVLGKPYIYDGKCRSLSKEEIAARQEAKKSSAVRFKIQTDENIVVDDIVQGKVKFDSRLIGDFIIVKSNGFPSYNYAVVIDDYEMKISHVIRGVGHLSNTPRQILIHNSLKLHLPQYAHISEISGSDRKKLSKRRGAVSILLFRDMGYHPQAFVNYMSLLGWCPRDSAEFMRMQKLEKDFDVIHCSKSPAVFDFFLNEKAGQKNIPRDEDKIFQSERQGDLKKTLLGLEKLREEVNKKSKLNWLNNLYMRDLPLEELWEEEKKWIEEDDNPSNNDLRELLAQDEDKVKHGFDCIRKYLYTFDESLPYLKELFQEKIQVSSEEAKSFLQEDLSQSVVLAFSDLLAEKKPQEPDEFGQVMKLAGAKTQAKGRALFMPIRIAVTGTMQGLELPVLFSILGCARISQRLKETQQIWSDKM